MEMEAEAYYYGRDAGWNPVVTICLLKNEAGHVAKGMAICSNLETPCKRKGRDIARGRALQALVREDNGLPVERFEACMTISETDCHELPSFKSSFNPRLDAYEKGLVRMNQKRGNGNGV